MRVAVNLEQLLYRSPGGIGRYSARLAMVLPQLFPGDEVLGFVAHHPRGRVDAAMAEAGLAGSNPTVLRLPRQVLYPAWHRLGGPPLTLGARRLADADVVHAPSVAVPPHGPAPLVVTVHDAAPELFPEAFGRRGLRFHRAGLAAAAARADMVLTVSHAAADEIVSHTSIPASRLRVVANGVDPVEVTDAARNEAVAAAGLSGRPYVLWVGSMEPRKGVGTLVAAMADLHRKGRDQARLVLAGYPGWLSDKIIDPGDRAVLGRDLVELGQVSETDLWGLYAGATLFALPSRHEGFGYPVLEAMTQGTPVVCSDIPVLREIAGDAAVLVPPGDVAAWATAVASLLEEPDLGRQLGDRGRANAARWSVERSIRGIRAVYAELV